MVTHAVVVSPDSLTVVNVNKKKSKKSKWAVLIFLTSFIRIFFLMEVNFDAAPISAT